MVDFSMRIELYLSENKSVINNPFVVSPEHIFAILRKVTLGIGIRLIVC